MEAQRAAGIVAGDGKEQAQRQHISRIESEIDRIHFAQAFEHQARAGEQYQGDRDFGDHHPPAQTSTAASSGGGARLESLSVSCTSGRAAAMAGASPKSMPVASAIAMV